MTRIKTPTQKKLYDSLNKRLDNYETNADTLINGFNERVAVLVATAQASVTDKKPFTFASSDNKAQLNNIISEAKVQIYAQILADTKKEWGNSNKAQDNLIDTSIRRYVGDEQADSFYQDNEDELKRFQERSDDGTTVYNRVDNHTKKYKSCLEAAISMALLTGATLGASYLLSRIKHYLSNFKELHDGYTKQYGEKNNLQDCKYYIKRLMRSEANMAYRRAELLRWNQMPFIIGYKICLSPGHKEADICDELKGNYPKNFIWTGWHPNDRCFCVPILQSAEGLKKGEEAIEITDMPEQFRAYIASNHDKIISSAQKGKLAYFLRDNESLWIDQFSKEERTSSLANISRTYTFADRAKAKISEVKFKSYDEDWTKAVFDSKTGGYNVYHKGHKFSKNKAKGATFSGGDAEKHVGNLLAKQGKHIEFLNETTPYGVKCADMRFDGMTWDVKYIATTKSSRTIRKHITEARKGDCVIFLWDDNDKLSLVKDALRSEVGDKTKRKKLSSLPNIFWMDKGGKLNLLWKK